MENDWPQVTVGEAAEISVGFAFRSAEFEIEPGLYRLVRGDNIKRGNIEWGEKTRYWNSTIPELERYLLREGDVIIGMDGSRVGENYAAVCGDDLPALLVQRVARLRHRNGVDQAYLRYAVCNQDFTKYVKAVHTGTSIPHISSRQIADFQIPLPPISQQHAVAHILNTLDDKIELNRRMNETLEAMARTLFKSWFVDFDPVHAKIARQNTGLPRQLAELFPEQIEYTNEGEIPLGWKTSTLHALADMNPESWTAKLRPEAVSYVDLSNAKGGYIADVKTMTWNEAPTRARRVLRKGDTILGTVRPGNRSFALIDEDGLTGSTGFAILRPRKDTDREYVWCATTSPQNIERLAHLADGAAYPAVRPDVVMDKKISLGPRAVQDLFSKTVGPILNRVEANRREMRSLGAVRDLLLPELITGRLEISEGRP